MTSMNFDRWLEEVKDMSIDEFYELPESEQIRLEDDYATLGLYTLEDEKFKEALQ